VNRAEALTKVALARVGRLATTDEEGTPHLVPIVYAVTGNRIYSAVDHKPKRTPRLKRLTNIAANPSVALLVDHYEDDWDRLWWIRIDGSAQVVESNKERSDAIELLAAKYRQYRSQPPEGTVMRIDIERVIHWSMV